MEIFMAQKPAVPAAPEVDINNPLHPLHPSNSDVRIIPEGWKASDAAPSEPLSHFDLRIKAAESEQESE
jgi:hypothetical protein